MYDPGQKLTMAQKAVKATAVAPAVSSTTPEKDKTKPAKTNPKKT